MGSFVNPGNQAFLDAVNEDIYIDKSLLISYVNQRIGKRRKYLCVSRPRRFGKSIAADMLTAYYSRGCDSSKVFNRLKIADDETYQTHLNQYDVIHIDVQWFRVYAQKPENTVPLLQKEIISELQTIYPECVHQEDTFLPMVLSRINTKAGKQFVIIIDEWDSLIREDKDNEPVIEDYLNLLRGLFKGVQPSAFIKLAYITGILPILKYDTQSSLNEFHEFTMLDPDELAEFVGFTETEVIDLCEQYHQDFNEVKRWYDGYLFSKLHIYNPKAIVSVMPRGRFKSYWSKTGSYESLQKYIAMNFDGLRDRIIEMLAGGRCTIDTETFQNKLTDLKSRDDVMTLLIHLGYLAYDEYRGEAYIPNEEIRGEFLRATRTNEWSEYMKIWEQSEQILLATLCKDTKTVEQSLEIFHMEHSSILAYNDENALSSLISMAYLSAVKYYFKPIRELPTGKGFADLVYLPKKECFDKPALLIELKWNKSAESAVEQIKRKNYTQALIEYSGEILMVGINYNLKSKKHQCIIEKWIKD